MFESTATMTTAPSAALSTDPHPEPADPPPDTAAAEVAALSNAQLDSDIRTLAGHLAAATCRWLLLVGEFDRRDAWASWGVRSTAHWLSWRCGMSAVTARDHIRVGRALLEFPLIRAAFAAGTLSFSKVRAITRVASPALEAELVTLAVGTTAAQTERIVRELRRALDREAPPPTPKVATLAHRWDDDGDLTVTVRLPAEEGALLLAALDAYSEILDAVRRAGDSDPSGSPPERAADEPTEKKPTGDRAQPCPEVDPERGPRSPVRDAESLLAIVTSALDSAPKDASGADRFEVVLHADVDQLATLTGDDERAGLHVEPIESLAHGRCHIHNGPAIYPATLRRMACDSRIRLMTHGADGSPKDVGRRLRLVTPPLRALLEERDHGRCRFPSCDRRRRLHAHHVIHWADGGPTDLDNLILLCPFHHQLVHEHGFTITTPTFGVFVFQRPDGSTIEDVPRSSGVDLIAAGPRLYAAPDITDETTTPEWWGDPLHILDAVDGLRRMRDRAAAGDSAEASWPYVNPLPPPLTGSPYGLAQAS